MKGDWRLIGRGMLVAAVGAAGAMLYIVGASAAFVGRPLAAVLALVAACTAAEAFRRTLGPFLAAIDRRNDETDLAIGGVESLLASSPDSLPRREPPS